MPPRERDFVFSFPHCLDRIRPDGEEYHYAIRSMIRLHRIICLEWPTFGQRVQSGICRSELGKLLVVGSVRAFYARAKWPKRPKRDRSETPSVKGRKLDTDPLEMSLFLRGPPMIFSPFLSI